MTFTTLPLLFPPEPENDLVTLFGELFAVSPKLIFPTLLVMVTVPTKVGKTPPSPLRLWIIPSIFESFCARLDDGVGHLSDAVLQKNLLE